MNTNDNAIRPDAQALLLAFLGVLGFSGTLPSTRAAVPHLGAITVGLGRAVVASGFAAALLVLRRGPLPERRHLGPLCVVALGVVVGFPLLSAHALETVPSSHAAIVVTIVPLATAVLGVLRAGERPPPSFWAASSIGSVAVLTSMCVGVHVAPSVADAWLVLASIAAAVGYSEGGRLAREIGAVGVICWALVLSALPLLLVVWLHAPLPRLQLVPASAWFGFAYVSVVSMFAAFIAWYAGLARAGIARASQIQLLQPFLSLVWAVVFLGERVEPRTIGAAMVVVGCVFVAARVRVVA